MVREGLRWTWAGKVGARLSLRESSKPSGEKSPEERPEPPAPFAIYWSGLQPSQTGDWGNCPLLKLLRKSGQNQNMDALLKEE